MVTYNPYYENSFWSIPNGRITSTDTGRQTMVYTLNNNIGKAINKNCEELGRLYIKGYFMKEKQAWLSRDFGSYNIDIASKKLKSKKELDINSGDRKLWWQAINIMEMVLSLIPNGRITSRDTRKESRVAHWTMILENL